jgi:hypothetical protein
LVAFKSFKLKRGDKPRSLTFKELTIIFIFINFYIIINQVILLGGTSMSSSVNSSYIHDPILFEMDDCMKPQEKFSTSLADYVRNSRSLDPSWQIHLGNRAFTQKHQNSSQSSYASQAVLVGSTDSITSSNSIVSELFLEKPLPSTVQDIAKPVITISPRSKIEKKENLEKPEKDNPKKPKSRIIGMATTAYRKGRSDPAGHFLADFALETSSVLDDKILEHKAEIAARQAAEVAARQAAVVAARQAGTTKTSDQKNVSGPRIAPAVFSRKVVVVDGRNANRIVGFQPKTPEMPDYRIGT